MAITYLTDVEVQSAAGNGVTTTAIDTTGATLLVMAVGRQDTTDSGPSDSAGNTWSTAVTRAELAVKYSIYYAKNPTISTAHTFSVTDAACFPVICAAAFAGTDTASNVDQTISNESTGFSTIQAGSVTPSADNELVISGLNHASTSTTPSINLGYTQIASFGLVAGAAYGGGLAYNIQTAASATNPTWTIASALFAQAANATFRSNIAAGTMVSLLSIGH